MRHAVPNAAWNPAAIKSSADPPGLDCQGLFQKLIRRSLVGAAIPARSSVRFEAWL
jgi:hypothetical protein